MCCKLVADLTRYCLMPIVQCGMNISRLGIPRKRLLRATVVAQSAYSESSHLTLDQSGRWHSEVESCLRCLRLCSASSATGKSFLRCHRGVFGAVQERSWLGWLLHLAGVDILRQRRDGSSGMKPARQCGACDDGIARLSDGVHRI